MSKRVYKLLNRHPKLSAGGSVALLSAMLLLTAAAHAATIGGVIVDKQSGRGVPSATIALKGTKRGAKADKGGHYLVENVPAGSYTIEVTSIGYAPEERSVVIAADEQQVTEDFSLVPRAVNAQDVVVQGRADRETDASARLTEKTAPSVVSVMSAESIAKYPDASTAEITKRVPGISVTRVRGEAREAIVRGMEGRYNNTLIDGLKVPSPSTNTHDVQLDYLSSDLLQRIEITKSLTPDMEADAIGGSVNLVMRTAPEQFLFRARLGTGYNSTLFNDKYVGFRTDSIQKDPLDLHGVGYQAKASDFTRDNLKLTESQAPPNLLGEFTIGGRVLDNKLGLLLGGSVQETYQHSVTTRNYDAVDPDNNPYLIRRQYRFHSHDKSKYGLNAKADFIADDHNDVQLSFVGFIRDNHETRILNDTNYVYSPVLYLSDRTVVQTYYLGDIVLSGHHDLGEFDIKWRGGWAKASQTKPDRAELTTSAALSGDSIVSDRVFYAVVRDWQRNDDRDIFGGADVAWKGLSDIGITVTAGALYRTKDRSNYQNEYRLNPVTDSAGHLPKFTTIDALQWEVLNTGGTPDYANNNYTVSEDVTAAYAMASWSSGNWNILAGARLENTSADYATFDVNEMAQVSATKTYSDVLPSVHIRYALDETSNLRLSVGQSMSRPNYFDLVPYNYVGDEFREMGNPNLKRTLSTNVDLKYEIFPSIQRQLSFGLFYKLINDPVENTLDLSNPAIPTLIPKNLGDATNIGFEVVAGTDFWTNFNVQANYTYTHSAITSDKILNDKSTGRVLVVPETRPLQGQSAHIGNLALSYTNPDWGSFVQASFSFTGRRIAQVNVYKGMDHYESDFPMLDLSVDQHIVGNLSLFLRLNNLLDTMYEVRILDGPLIEQEKFGETFTLGFNYHY